MGTLKWAAHLRKQRIQHVLDVFVYIDVVNSENAIAQLFEVGSAHRVGVQLARLSGCASVNLDNELALTAYEVAEVWPNGLLAYELETA